MLIPMRCFSCGKVVGNKWDRYLKLIRTNITSKAALDRLGLRRYCCRRMILCHFPGIDRHLTNQVCGSTQQTVE